MRFQVQRSGSFPMARVAATLAVILTSAAAPLAAQGGAQQSASPYVRYVTPGWCAAAVERMGQLYWRDKRSDTVVYAPLTDSVPTPARDSAAACSARFTVANTPERELLALVQLELALGRADQARAAADRLIAAQAKETATQRGWIVRLVAESFVDAKPALLTDGKRYLAALDSIGAPAATWRVMAHMRFGEFAFSVGDVPAATAEYDAAIAASKQMSLDERKNNLRLLMNLYAMASEVTGAAQGGTAALQLVATAQTELMQLRPAGSRDAQGILMQIRRLEALYKMYGSKAPQLTASHWYVVKGDTVRPRAGVTSLIYLGNANCGGICYPSYATIRRLQAKYGDALETTVITGTAGYYRNHPTPGMAAESDSVGHYFNDFLKLPAGVAASEVEFSFRPDGRRANRAPENFRNYSRGPSAALVAPDGTIKLMVDIGPRREKLVDDAIAAMQKK
jgi:hypothetical protein